MYETSAVGLAGDSVSFRSRALQALWQVDGMLLLELTILLEEPF
jgi:hypothetical protein